MLIIVFTRAKIFSHMIWKNHILSFHEHTSRKNELNFFSCFRVHTIFQYIISDLKELTITSSFSLHEICIRNECCYYSLDSLF